MKALNQRYLDTSTDEVFQSEAIIDSLPGGLGQQSQSLPEPIIIQKFKSITVAPEPSELGGKLKIKKNKCKCKKCKKPIKHADRRWVCKKCAPVLSQDIGDAVFF